MKRARAYGFTLIEMVIVILILGIIAAVAAPRMFDTANRAEENATRQRLAVLRNAIEMYRARSGLYPTQGKLPEAMATMLNGPFPAASIGPNAGSADVYYDSSSDTAAMAEPDTKQSGGWVYKPANGTIRVNVANGEVGHNW